MYDTDNIDRILAETDKCLLNGVKHVNKMKERIFPIHNSAFSAICVSISSFYFCIWFSIYLQGASTEVINNGRCFRSAKLVVASLLYQYWDTINKYLEHIL